MCYIPHSTNRSIIRKENLKIYIFGFVKLYGMIREMNENITSKDSCLQQRFREHSSYANPTNRFDRTSRHK